MRGCYLCGKKPTPSWLSTPDHDYELCQQHGEKAAQRLVEERRETEREKERTKQLATMLRRASHLQAEDRPQG